MTKQLETLQNQLKVAREQDDIRAELRLEKEIDGMLSGRTTRLPGHGVEEADTESEERWQADSLETDNRYYR